ncbi:MAG: hypothetical protein HY656_03915 [Acidobacteria bacterium]|nr:hypothetical protein [Acidobacteriota bacterium]
MGHKGARALLAVGLAVLITLAPGLNLVGGNISLGTVRPQGAAELNRTPLRAESTVYSGDTISTPGENLAVVQLPQGSQIYVGPTSTVRVEAADAGVWAGLVRGTLLARSRPGEKVSVWAANLLVSPDTPGALYQVELVSSGAVVAARRGAVKVEGANRTVTVPAGKSLRFEVADSSQAPAGAGAGAGLSAAAKAIIVIVVVAAVATAIAVPVALNDEQQVVSPPGP